MTEAHPAHSTGGASRVGGGDLLPLVSRIGFWTSGRQTLPNRITEELPVIRQESAQSRWIPLNVIHAFVWWRSSTVSREERELQTGHLWLRHPPSTRLR